MSDAVTLHKWAEFHRENPHIFDLFVRFADEARKAGRTHFSCYMIRERIRWYTSVETTSMPEVKFSNNHTPYYARLLLAKYPEKFAGLFRLNEMQDEPDPDFLIAADNAVFFDRVGLTSGKEEQ